MRVVIISLLVFITLRYPANAGFFDPLPAGARAIGMASSFSALADDATAVYWNPAGLSQIAGKEMAAYYTEPYGLGLIYSNFLAYTQSGIGKGTVGVAYKGTGTTDDVSFLRYRENTVYLSYSRLLFKKLSLGASAKFLRVEMMPQSRALDRITGTDYGIDLGFIFHFNKYLQFGGVGQDINTPVVRFDNSTKDRVPYKIRGGLTVKPVQNWNLVFESGYLQGEEADFQFGSEYWMFNGRFGVRAGAQKPELGDWNFSGGFSLQFRKVYIEYAAFSHFDMNLTNHVSLRMRF